MQLTLVQAGLPSSPLNTQDHIENQFTESLCFMAPVLHLHSINLRMGALVTPKQALFTATGLNYGDKVTYKDPRYSDWKGTIIGSLGPYGLVIVKWDAPLLQDGHHYTHEVAVTQLRKLPA
jgi:hypothetical protein